MRPPFIVSASIALLTLVSAPLCLAGLDPATNITRIEQTLETQVDQGFRGQVLIESEGRIILDRAFGLADSVKGAEATPDTLYYIGSIAKQFTGTVILQLQAEGRLALDDSISKYLDLVPEDKRAITIQHLLAHTSGLVSNHADPLTKFDRSGFLSWTLATDLQAAPGERHSYSNAGYSILAAIIEHIEARPFPEVVRDRIWEPAGMSDTFFLDDPALDPARLAVGSGPLALSMNLSGSPLEFGPTWLRLGCGGIVSTARDLLKWERAIRAGAVLTPEQYELATTPSTPGWGLAWRLSRTTRGTPLHFHDGGFPGFNSAFARLPDEKVAIIVLCNSEEVARPAAAMILRELFVEAAPAPEPSR